MLCGEKSLSPYFSNNGMDLGLHRAPLAHCYPFRSPANLPRKPGDLVRWDLPQVALMHRLTIAAVYLRVLQLVHEALVTGISVTKRYYLYLPASHPGIQPVKSNLSVSIRDIYYKDPNLFCKQSVVDKCVDTLTYTFEESRNALNVVRATNITYCPRLRDC